MWAVSVKVGFGNIFFSSQISWLFTLVNHVITKKFSPWRSSSQTGTGFRHACRVHSYIVVFLVCQHFCVVSRPSVASPRRSSLNSDYRLGVLYWHCPSSVDTDTDDGLNYDLANERKRCEFFERNAVTFERDLAMKEDKMQSHWRVKFRFLPWSSMNG